MNNDSDPKPSNTIEKLKSMIKEYEKIDNSQDEINDKRMSIGENLSSTLEMLGDVKGGTLSHINTMINEYLSNSKIEMTILENSLVELRNSFSIDKLMKQDFVEKRHTFRQSLLSIMLLNDKNISALYYLIVAFFLWLVVWVFVDDYITTKTLDYNRIKSLFSGFSTVIITWIVMYLYSLLIVIYIKIIEFLSAITNKINYKTTIIIYVFYQLILYVFATIVIFQSEIANACGMIIGCEMARLSMKIHAYFREKLLYGLKNFHIKLALFSPFKKDNLEDKMPQIDIVGLEEELRRFIFFSFCPSLIYRDKYPRLINYRFDMILAHLTNFTLCLMSMYMLSRYICSPYFTSMKLRNYFSFAHFCYDCCRLAIPGTMFLITGFFMILHTWLNLWSEILRYGDRRFYEDWWNCTNFEEWYRKWNMVVHEWLYYYVYNDVMRLTGTMSRLVCKICVFSLSVIIHEIIVWQTIGFFFPILSFFFGGPGIIFTYIKPKQKRFNLLFWVKLCLGIGILFCLLLMEVHLREVVDKELGLNSYWHSNIPRSLLIYFESYKEKIVASNKY
jgi:sterol O-acyltransferase